MQKENMRKSIWNTLEIVLILALCVATLVLDFVKVSYIKDTLQNSLLAKVIQQTCGIIAAVLLMRRFNINLFGKPQNWLYLIPCMIIAIDNFQFSSYFNGNMKLLNKEPLDFIFFAGYCLSVGIFEECIFRGVIFSVLAGYFSKDKKGLWKTYIISSIIFGAAHLFNGFSLGTILQVGYTTLTGGLFAFALLKTKNIFCCGFIHALYNFAGLLFETEARLGLGSGVVFDTGTVITMLVVCISVGAFILYSVFKYSTEEQVELYQKLGVPMNDNEEEINS